jgi:beta-glucosidase
LITSVQTPEVAARWNNNMQALVEGIGLGIPANNSTDPRNSTNAGVEYTAGAGGKISQWPESLGFAATFDPSVVQGFGQIASQEYRAGHCNGFIATDWSGYRTQVVTHQWNFWRRSATGC